MLFHDRKNWMFLSFVLIWRFGSSRMFRCVVWYGVTDVSKRLKNCFVRYIEALSSFKRSAGVCESQRRNVANDLQWRTQEVCSVGVQQIQLRTERTVIWWAVAPLVRGSGGSCNLVQEISLILGTFRLFMMTINLFVIANVKQLRTGGSCRILLPFFRTSWGVGVLNSANC